MCFPCVFALSSFPWKQLGFIELAPKAWMVETTLSISLLNLLKGYPSAQSVSQNEAYFCALQKNVWWNRDTNMKTARHPLWNRSRFRETAGAVKNKRAPDVRLVESGHQNQTRRLAQRFCWLEPAAPPPPPPYSPSYSLLLSPSSFFPFSAPLLVCTLLDHEFPFFIHTLFAFHPAFLSLCVPSLHFIPGTSP